jgi:hypothetical protein
MTNQRFELTRYVLKAHNKPHDDEYVKKMLPAFWQNPRTKDSGGFRLTESGYNWLKTADIKEYKIDLPAEIKWTNQLIIWLDHYIDCPFYITKKSIFVFGERMAVQLVLFSGDIQKYGLSKAKSVAKAQQESSLTSS